jgi:hypothetical protein
VQKADEQARAPKLDRAIQDRIGRELRAMYAGLVTQPVPDRLLVQIYNLQQPSDLRATGGGKLASGSRA